MAKLIYAKTRTGFNTAYPDKAPIDKSIAFIEDGWIWTHGKYFKIFPDATPLFTVDATNAAAVAIKDVNNNTLFSLNLGVLTVSGDGVVEAAMTANTGAVTLSHKTIGEADVSVGPTANSGSSIVVPQITFDKYGHYLSVTNRTATLTNVTSNNVDSSSVTHYLVGSSTSATATAQLQKTSNINFVPSTGVFNATSFVENGTALSAKYAPLSHTTITASGSVLGHVTLSDSITSTSGASSGIAATPKAINDVYKYAQNIIASGDAMIFKGTIGSTGIITGGTDVDGKKLETLTDYKAGWTFKAAVAQTITGIGKLEVGDIVMAVTNKGAAYNNVDFTVIQVNIDGAVTSSASLTTNQLILGASVNGIKSLAAGTSGQYLMANSSGIPTWTTVAKNYRGVSVNGTSALTESDLSALVLRNGSGISMSWNSTNKEVVVATNLQSLGIQNSGALLGSYAPSASTNNIIDFGSGLTATLASNKFTVNHSNSTTAQATSAVRSFTYDAQGHITGSTVITSLPTANSITFSDGKTTPVTTSFNGSNAVAINFLPATGDININAVKTGNNLTYTLGLTHRYRPVAYKTTTAATKTVISNNSTATELVLVPGNSNVTMAYTSGELRISSANTWRNVFAYTGATLGEVLPTSIGTDDLQFGSEFSWDNANKEIKIGWAEVSSTGAISYSY